jgi:hypothetical protein
MPFYSLICSVCTCMHIIYIPPRHYLEEKVKKEEKVHSMITTQGIILISYYTYMFIIFLIIIFVSLFFISTFRRPSF